MDWIYLYQGSAIILYQTEGGQEVNLLCGGAVPYCGAGCVFTGDLSSPVGFDAWIHPPLHKKGERH